MLSAEADFFMPKTKEQKKEIVQDLKEKIKKQKSIVFVDFSGLKAKTINEIRKKMRENDSEFKVAKKTLMEIALGNKEIKDLQGEIGIGFGFKDEVMPFKILGDFSQKEENLELLAGLIGEEFVDKEKAVAISKLPGREELLARMVGSVSAPISGLVNAMQGNIQNLVYVLTAIKGR